MSKFSAGFIDVSVSLLPLFFALNYAVYARFRYAPRGPPGPLMAAASPLRVFVGPAVALMALGAAVAAAGLAFPLSSGGNFVFLELVGV